MRDVRGSARALGILACLFLGACRPGAAPRLEEAPAESYGTRVLRGDGFTLRYPDQGTVEAIPVPTLARSALRIVGPSLAVRPADADWTVAGPAFLLEAVTYDNPEGLSAADWVRQHALGEEVVVHDSAATRVGGEPAFRVSTFGGDSEWVTFYVPAGGRIVSLRYNDMPPANNPLAPLQRGVHDLMISSFRPAEARAAAQTPRIRGATSARE